VLNDPGILISAFLLGFLGSAHCLGMCGGLASALGLNTPIDTTKQSNRFYFLVFYNTGRIISYCIAGLIVGALGFWLSKQLSALEVLRYLAGALLILMGLYLGQWFNGILWTEKLGSKLWPLIQPFSKRFMPVRSLKDALFVGLIWGWLPCGLVYSALIWASLEANVIGSSMIMLAFGIGTLPSMLATGIFAQNLSKIIRQQWFRSVAGGLMILFGVWSLPIVQQLVYQVLKSH
jgi:sulfite exporter TauE/SafE